jgi:hypothetical protein
MLGPRPFNLKLLEFATCSACLYSFEIVASNTLSELRKIHVFYLSTIVGHRTHLETVADDLLLAEKALMSLPSPLTAGDEWTKPHNLTVEVVRVTAGLHRQVWVSGTSIYVDVHIVNNCRKQIKRIELQLERDILCYKHVGFFANSLCHPLKHAKDKA